VFTPESKRRWGYYVLPILFRDRLVGRIEPWIDGDDARVRVLGLWWEEGFLPDRGEGFVDAMRDALGDYLPSPAPTGWSGRHTSRRRTDASAFARELPGDDRRRPALPVRGWKGAMQQRNARPRIRRTEARGPEGGAPWRWC